MIPFNHSIFLIDRTYVGISKPYEAATHFHATS